MLRGCVPAAVDGARGPYTCSWLLAAAKAHALAHGGGRGPVVSPVFKTVWASVIPAPVGSTPMRPRHCKARNDGQEDGQEKTPPGRPNNRSINPTP